MHEIRTKAYLKHLVHEEGRLVVPHAVHHDLEPSKPSVRLLADLGVCLSHDMRVETGLALLLAQSVRKTVVRRVPIVDDELERLEPFVVGQRR